ncbi:MAG: hypothetical protein Q9213_007273 [Squamulea squamosa]
MGSRAIYPSTYKNAPKKTNETGSGTQASGFDHGTKLPPVVIPNRNRTKVVTKKMDPKKSTRDIEDLLVSSFCGETEAILRNWKQKIKRQAACTLPQRDQIAHDDGRYRIQAASPNTGQDPPEDHRPLTVGEAADEVAKCKEAISDNQTPLAREDVGQLAAQRLRSCLSDQEGRCEPCEERK